MVAGRDMKVALICKYGRKVNGGGGGEKIGITGTNISQTMKVYDE